MLHLKANDKTNKRTEQNRKKNLVIALANHKRHKDTENPLNEQKFEGN